MRIRVEVSGHRFSDSVEGEVLLWSTGVDRHADGSVPAVSVPCVVLKTTTEVKTIPLQQRYMQVKVVILEETASPLSGSTAA